MAGKTVAERTTEVPALRPTPALAIGPNDVITPRIYIGQYSSKAVQEGLVKAGDIYAASGADDPSPIVVEPPLVFYVLSLRLGKSFSDGGELQIWDFEDLSAPPEAWVTYNYVVYAPEADTDLPCKFLLTKSGRPAALQINTVIKRNSIKGPAWLDAFALTTAARENTKGKFFVARVAQTEPNKEHVAAAEALAVQLSSSASEFNGASAEGPAI